MAYGYPNGHESFYNRFQADYFSPQPSYSDMPSYDYTTSRNRRDYSSEHTYDPRYSYSRRTHSPPHQQPRPNRRARSWPPSPSVEDEDLSLSREFGSINLSADDDEACNRGTVNQEPIIQDVEPVRKKSTEDWTPVLVSKEDVNASGRPRQLSVDTSFNTIPEFGRRERTPYSYRPMSSGSDRASNRTSRDFTGSSETIGTINSTTSRPGTSDGHSQHTPKSANTLRVPGSNPSASASEAGDSDLDSDDVSRLRTRRAPSRYSFNSQDIKQNEQRPNLQKSIRGEATLSSPSSKSSYKTDEDKPKRRKSQRRPEIVDYPSQKASSASSSRQTSGTSKVVRYDEDVSSYSSRPSSRDGPTSSTNGLGINMREVKPKSEKKGSRLSGEYSAQSIQSHPHSFRSSEESIKSESSTRSSTHHNSRPTSFYGQYGNMDVYASPSQTYNPDDWYREAQRAKVTSQPQYGAHPNPYGPYSAPQSPQVELPQNQMYTDHRAPHHSRTRSEYAQQPHRTESLPYPEHNNLMPSEPGFHYPHPNASVTSLPPPPKEPPSRSSSARPPKRVDELKRPTLEVRHESYDKHARARSVDTRPAPSSRSSTSSSKYTPTTSSQSSMSSTAPLAQTVVLPPCPRSDFTSHYFDWYTIMSLPGHVDICPYCMTSMLESHPEYRLHFMRAPPRPYGTRTRCDMSDPWLRIAWQLTVLRQVPDLRLLHNIAVIRATEYPCPSEQRHQLPGSSWDIWNIGKTWYALDIDDPALIHGKELLVCVRDKKFLENLMPSLSNAFSKVYSTTGKARHCILGPDEDNWSEMMDMLIRIDEAIILGRKMEWRH